MATYLKAPSVERLPVVLQELHQGSLRIPPFQRDFEWSGEQRLALCDSILRGLPTGSLMVWRTSHRLREENPVGPFWVKFTENASQYLLDGRQRMTTLYATLGAGFFLRDEEKVPAMSEGSAPDGTPWQIAYDLERTEFVFAAPREDLTLPFQASLFAPEPSSQKILPLAVLFDDASYDDWRAAGNYSRELLNRARSLRTAFSDYLIPVLPLATDDIDIVTLTFKRVNSGGTPMGDADMTRALAWSEGYDLRVQIESIRERLRPVGWGGLDSDTILKTVASVALPEPTTVDVEELATRIKTHPEVVDRAGERLYSAVGLLSNRLGICGPFTLPYLQILVFTARIIDKCGGSLDPLQEDHFVEWAAEACLDERFSIAAPHMTRAYFRALTYQIGLELEPVAARRRNPAECWKFRMIWARSRATALVLAARRPRRPSGRPIEDASRLVATDRESLGMFVARGGAGLPPRVRDAARDGSLGMALQSPANRVVCSAFELPDLREAVFTPGCDPEILESHLIDADAHAALLTGRLSEFFELRRARIIRAEEAWVRERGGAVEIQRDPRKYSDG